MPYKVITGFNYPDEANPGKEIRVNAGTVLDELPANHAQGIIDLGCVEETDADIEATADEVLGKGRRRK